MMTDFIKDSIKISDISFNKNNKLKNGDTVIARCKLSSKNFNIVFDNDIIEKEYTVSNLEKLINEYTDLSKDMISKNNVRITDDMDIFLSSVVNPYIERFGLFQYKMSYGEIQNYMEGSIGNNNSLLIVDKVTYKYNYFDEEYKTTYYIYEMSDFDNDGGSMDCSFEKVGQYDYTTDTEIENMINSWGYKKIWY